MTHPVTERLQRQLAVLSALAPPDAEGLLAGWDLLHGSRGMLSQVRRHDPELAMALGGQLDEVEAALAMRVALLRPEARWRVPHVLEGAAPATRPLPTWRDEDPVPVLRAAAVREADGLALRWTEAVDSPGLAHPWVPGAWWRALKARVQLGVWLTEEAIWPAAAQRLTDLRGADERMLQLGRVLESPVVGFGEERLLGHLVEAERFAVLWRTPRGFRMPGTLVLRA